MLFTFSKFGAEGLKSEQNIQLVLRLGQLYLQLAGARDVVHFLSLI